MLARFVSGSGIEGERKPRQTLLTRSSQLALKLNDYLVKLITTLSTTVPDLATKEDENFVKPFLSEEGGHIDTIFDLNNDSFPLVCTYENLLQLLELSITHSDQEHFEFPDLEGNDEEENELETPDEIGQQHRPRQLLTQVSEDQPVDFQSFKLDYWPRLPSNLTQRVPIELAFAEIMGVIEGSPHSREALTPLSRAQYIDLSSRLAPSFSREFERSRLYDIFEKYQALKARGGDLDDIDRVIRVVKALRRNMTLLDYLRTAIDEIYIDEVQDLRSLDIELLLNLLKDGSAFHFAGDTAQTISQDSTFRFQDVKALMHSHFAGIASATHRPEASRPQLFTLANNYRSHQGILGLASLVMEVLWKIFPETVDKLKPEVGKIHGPLPVMFLACDANIFALTGIEHSDRPRESLQFGAEQVILVRDTAMKRQLQGTLGDGALILTILQNKGMEFEDVIAWNIFTKTPYPSGWRCIGALAKNLMNSEKEKHSGMCFELTLLYVAVTRARIRLSFVEAGESLPSCCASFLKQSMSMPLVEITDSSNPDFLKDLFSLPSGSNDPTRWSERGLELMQHKQYKDAAICFRRARDSRGEAVATAFILEEEGRRLIALGDTNQAQICFKSAVEKFVGLGMIREATASLERRKEFEEAAWIWADHKHPIKAALLFAKASKFQLASDQYHQALDFDRAADALRRGALADKLVSYITENRSNLSSNALQCQSRYCILLLKEDKISCDFLAPAISLLGSSSEQEKAFSTYGMDDHLANLYQQQKRFEECFLLHFRAGKLDRALKVTDCFEYSGNDMLRRLAQRAQAYHFVGAIVSSSRDSKIDKYIASISNQSEWAHASKLVGTGKQEYILDSIQHMKDRTIKDFLQVHSVLNLNLSGAVKLADPKIFLAFETAIRIADIVSSSPEFPQEEIVLLFCGLMEIEHPKRSFITMPWSPLLEQLSNSSADEYPKLANKWYLDAIGKVLLKLDDLLKELWNFTIIYNRRVMDEIFQSQFTGMRRSWLEKLLRECTFISSLENSSQAISKFKSKILHARQHPLQDKRFLALLADLEQLLFHKLGKEWKDRSDISSLLEQVQISYLFGNMFHSFFNKPRGKYAQYLSRKLSHSSSMEFQQHVHLKLRSVEFDMSHSDIHAFQTSLKQFTSELCNGEAEHFSSFHSIVTIFELFAAYLIFKSGRVAFFSPRSWLDNHFPWFIINERTEEVREVSDRTRILHAKNLVDLMIDFCELVRYVCPAQGTGFRLGIAYYPVTLLNWRVAEILALAVVNLSFNSFGVLNFRELREKVRQVLSLPALKAYHLEHDTIPVLFEKLVKSFENYDDKDCLQFVRKGKSYHAADGLAKKLGVKTIFFSELFSDIPTSINFRLSSRNHFSEAADDRRIQNQIEKAASNIWRFWQRHYPKLQSRRRFLNSAEGKLRTQFLDIFEPNSPISRKGMKLRVILTEQAVHLQQTVNNLENSISGISQVALSLLDYLPQERFEEIDELMQKDIEIENKWESITGPVSLGQLRLMIRSGCDVEELHQLLETTESTLRGKAHDTCIFGKAVADIIKEQGNAINCSKIEPGSHFASLASV
ncbi:MAG: hypothetical protein M1814_005106 [Vezdaea aestivalis]|nr:MAG: hypothetical protein M1814_005106 [Vezdaea aestivalis]